jgi:histidyl-tRNA synthetase
MDFLDRLVLESRVSRFLLIQLETLRKEGSRTVADRLTEVYPTLGNEGLRTSTAGARPAPSPRSMVSPNVEGSLEIIETMDQSEARTVVLSLLDGMTIKLDSLRDPDEIAGRLLTKMKRQDQTPKIRQALMFMNELGQLVGEPVTVLREAEQLLAAYAVDRSPLDHLRATIENLEH